MNDVPAIIGGAKVICYAVVNLLDYETKTDGFAICQNDGEKGYYLFSCDSDWKEFSDTWHESIDEAIDQADYECKGVGKIFQKLN